MACLNSAMIMHVCDYLFSRESYSFVSDAKGMKMFPLFPLNNWSNIYF